MDGLVISPIVNIIGVVAALAVVWWRVSILEREVIRLRDDRHAIANQVTRMEGKVDVLLSMLSRSFANKPQREL